MEYLANCQEFPMSDPSSELVEISKLNGDFKRNYGRLIGAYLYLSSVSAARGRSVVWGGLLFTLISASAIWLEKHGFHLIVSGTRGCEFWTDDVAFATQARSIFAFRIMRPSASCAVGFCGKIRSSNLDHQSCAVKPPIVPLRKMPAKLQAERSSGSPQGSHIEY